MLSARRWPLAGFLVAAGWWLSPDAVPIYDGVGFPDAPYRFVADSTPPTAAEAVLRTRGGINTTGLLANSKEVGPQVSVYAPPGAFALPRASDVGPIRLLARPIALAPPRPEGVVQSNVYELTLTGAGGAVTVQPAAQHPTITLRAATATSGEVVLYRISPSGAWRALATSRVGRDAFDADAPGAGEYVLVRKQVTARESHTRTFVLGGTLLLLVIVVAVIRLRAA